MDNIEHLYQCYEILSEAGDKISEHKSEYQDILNAVRGSSKEKRLASQFIGKFFSHFPDLADKALDAQLDLCEDDDMQIRRQAIKDLPKLCHGMSDITAKVADTLAQLLVLDEALELQQVNTSLQTIIKMDTKSALTGIMSQISTGDEATRERCFKFIHLKFLPMGSTVVTKEIEEFLIKELKTILQDVTSEEFHLCINILAATKLGSTITGHAELVNLSKEQAELNNDVDTTAMEENVERFIQCSTHAMPYFSSTIKSTDFVAYVCDKLLPINVWKAIDGVVGTNQIQLRLLKIFAEMCNFSGPLDDAATRVHNVYTVLREYMPLPQLNDNDEATTSPSFQFSHAECLLYVLHTLGKKNPDSMAFLKDQDKLKDFRARLQFLARGTQGYIKKLEEAIKGKSTEELKSEEHQLKVSALKTTSNISILIRDLFHSPPSLKHDIKLSWIQKTEKAGVKRAAMNSIRHENGQSDEKKSRGSSEQKIYLPPSGKYSAKVDNYGNNSRMRSRNGGGGGGFNRNRRGFKKY